MASPKLTVYSIGVDPGLSMGLYVLRNTERFGFWQGTPMTTLQALDLLLVKLRDDDPGAKIIVACERYISTSRPGKTHQPIAQVVIGQVQLVVERHSIDIEWQAPADAKRFAPTTFLRKHGLYVTAREVNCRDANDVNDAARHAVLLLAKRFAAIFERLHSS